MTDTMTTPEWRLQDRLIRSLDHAHVSVAEMATILGVSRQTVSNYLHGHTIPTLGYLRVWADTCEVDLGWLVRDTAGVTRRELLLDVADPSQLVFDFALAA